MLNMLSERETDKYIPYDNRGYPRVNTGVSSDDRFSL